QAIKGPHDRVGTIVVDDGESLAANREVRATEDEIDSRKIDLAHDVELTILRINCRTVDHDRKISTRDERERAGSGHAHVRRSGCRGHEAACARGQADVAAAGVE